MVRTEARPITSLAAARRGVLVVAHPDDESLWFGGLVSSTPHIEWKIICCSIPRRDPIRAQRFEVACTVLGAHESMVLPHTESAPNRPLNLRGLSAQNFEGYDLVVTHGPDGEYGHFHHRQISAWVTLRRPDAVTCGYRVRSCGSFMYPLTVAQWERKLRALQCYYDVALFRGQALAKWEALLHNYGAQFDFKNESYDGLAA